MQVVSNFIGIFICMIVSTCFGRKILSIISILFQIIFLWIYCFLCWRNYGETNFLGLFLLVTTNISYRIGEIYFLTMAESLPPIGISICFSAQVITRSLIIYTFYVVYRSSIIPPWSFVCIQALVMWIMF